MSNEVKRTIPIRLRQLAERLMPAMHGDKTNACLCRRAADEIERLANERNEARTERDALRAELAEVKGREAGK